MTALAVVETTALPAYERMCSAIAECVRVDEAKDIRDKAVALEAYYRQARNLEAEREAANIRLRAERKVGELLRELERGQGERTDLRSTSPSGREKSEYASTLEAQSISTQAASRFQALANIPEADFEAALSAPVKPTTKGVISRANLHSPAPKPIINDDALWVWGRLRDLERDGYFDADAVGLLDGMTDAMRADVRRLMPDALDFFIRLQEAANESA